LVNAINSGSPTVALSRKRNSRTQGLLALGASVTRFPSTRYQGSKLKLLDWLWDGIRHLHFDSALDVFSGTSSVAYLFKVHGKTVTTNDYLSWNRQVSEALVCNSGTQLSATAIATLFSNTSTQGGGFIEKTFKDVFYPDEENRWLDTVAQRVFAMPSGAQRSLAYFALYQACIAKRPYNLFHRANLYMRTAVVERTFGNKATWEKSFEEHCRGALHEAHGALFDNGRTHRAIHGDFLDAPENCDLVYMDPPYLNAKGTGVDYLEFYHFLEGLTEYPEWPLRYTAKYKHKPYVRRKNLWGRKDTILKAFDLALEKFRKSMIVISYRSHGIPSIEDITGLLRRHNRKDALVSAMGYKYVLANKSGDEVLLLSEP